MERALADSDENRRLEQVGAEMDRLRDKREVVTKRAATFDRHLGSWEKGLSVREEEDFLTLRRELDTQLPRIEAKVVELDEKIPEISYLLKKANEKVDSLENERKYLLDANSNIPSEIARLRTGLATALDRDTKELPFIGELIQVVPDEVKWTGPIERLLRSFSLTVVVPQKLADEAEAFLEVNQLGDRLSFICPQSDRKNPNFMMILWLPNFLFGNEKVRQTWLRSNWLRDFLIFVVVKGMKSLLKIPLL